MRRNNIAFAIVTGLMVLAVLLMWIFGVESCTNGPWPSC